MRVGRCEPKHDKQNGLRRNGFYGSHCKNLSYKADYQWLSRVYESVKPTDGRGGLIWASLGAKTIELVSEPYCRRSR